MTDKDILIHGAAAAGPTATRRAHSDGIESFFMGESCSDGLWNRNMDATKRETRETTQAFMAGWAAACEYFWRVYACALVSLAEMSPQGRGECESDAFRAEYAEKLEHALRNDWHPTEFVEAYI